MKAHDSGHNVRASGKRRDKGRGARSARTADVLATAALADAEKAEPAVTPGQEPERAVDPPEARRDPEQERAEAEAKHKQASLERAQRFLRHLADTLKRFDGSHVGSFGAPRGPASEQLRWSFRRDSAAQVTWRLLLPYVVSLLTMKYGASRLMAWLAALKTGSGRWVGALINGMLPAVFRLGGLEGPWVAGALQLGPVPASQRTLFALLAATAYVAHRFWVKYGWFATAGDLRRHILPGRVIWTLEPEPVDLDGDIHDDVRHEHHCRGPIADYDPLYFYARYEDGVESRRVLVSAALLSHLVTLRNTSCLDEPEALQLRIERAASEFMSTNIDRSLVFAGEFVHSQTVALAVGIMMATRERLPRAAFPGARSL